MIDEERFTELLNMTDGWHDGDYPAPSELSVHAMRNLIIDLSNNNDIPSPNLYPTASGGVVSEWSIGDWEASIEINQEANIFELISVNVQTGSSHDSVIKSDDAILPKLCTLFLLNMVS